jgi:hypothetical protein
VLPGPFRQSLDGELALGRVDYLKDEATNTILTDARHPSSLTVGVMPGRRAGAPLPACDSSLNEPCRPDSIGRPSGSLQLTAGSSAPESTDRRPSRRRSASHCDSRRVFTVRVPRRRGDRLDRVRLTINGRRVAVRRHRGRLVARFDHRGRTRPVRVRITAHYRSNRVVRTVRVYRPCTKRPRINIRTR